MMKSVLSGTIVVVMIETFTQAYQGTTIELNIIPASKEGCTLLPMPLLHSCTNVLKTYPPSHQSCAYNPKHALGALFFYDAFAMFFLYHVMYYILCLS